MVSPYFFSKKWWPFLVIVFKIRDLLAIVTNPTLPPAFLSDRLFSVLTNSPAKIRFLLGCHLPPVVWTWEVRPPPPTPVVTAACYTAGHYGEEYDDWNSDVFGKLQQRCRRTNRRRKSIPRSSSSHRECSITVINSYGRLTIIGRFYILTPPPLFLFSCHRRSQYFGWGALFSSKSWRPFYSRHPQHTCSSAKFTIPTHSNSPR